MGINDIGFESGRFRRHHNLLTTQGKPNITGPIQKGKGKGNTAGKGHGKGNGAGGGAIAQYTTRVPLNTSTGIQEITISGLGFTPKLAVFSVVRATADGTPLPALVAGFGMASGASEQGAVAYRGDDVNRVGSKTECLLLPTNNTGAGTFLARATFDSFVANGCRINITTAPPAGYFLVVRFFGGAGVVAAKVGTFAFPNSSTSTVTPGIRTHLMLLATMGHTMDGTFKGGAGAFGLGFLTNDGTTVRQCSMLAEANSPGGTWGNGGRVRDTQVASFGATATSSVGSITATQFSVTTSINVAYIEAVYASIELTTPANAWCGVKQTGTATGSQDITGPSFTPTSLMIAPSTYTALNSDQSDGHGGGWGVSFIDGAQYCNGVNVRDNHLSAAHQSVSDDRAVNIYRHDGGAIGAGASLTSFSSGKATLNFTDTNGEAYYWPCLFTNGI